MLLKVTTGTWAGAGQPGGGSKQGRDGRTWVRAEAPEGMPVASGAVDGASERRGPGGHPSLGQRDGLGVAEGQPPAQPADDLWGCNKLKTKLQAPAPPGTLFLRINF